VSSLVLDGDGGGGSSGDDSVSGESVSASKSVGTGGVSTDNSGGGGDSTDQTVSGVGNGGGGGDGGSSDGTDGDSWGGHGVDLGSGVGQGAGLVDGLLVGGVGGDWSDDGLGPEDGLSLEDRLGHVVGGGDCARLDGPDGSGGVDVGGLGHWHSPGGDDGVDLGEGVGLSGGVGEVASQPVVLDGGRVVLGGTDQDGSGDDWGWDSGDHASGGGGGGGQDSDESLHFVCAEKRRLSTRKDTKAM